MIEKLPFTEIHTGGENMVDLVEYRPVAPYEMQHKINELIDTVNRLEESVQGVVNNSITDGGRIQSLQEQINALKTRPENVRELITLTDMFNEMGRLYADLWNKLEDIHHELRKEQ